MWVEYGTRTDARSARELLAGRLAAPDPEPAAPMEHVPLPPGKALQKKVARGIFGMLRKRL